MAKGEIVKTEEMTGELMKPGQEAMAIATTRAAQEVQAAMIIAKKFPRDAIQAEKRILDACKRPHLAEQAMYAYPRGGTTVEGPSIRLAEVLSQNWGNLDTGIIELEQSDGESTVMAYCWDLETNTRQTKIFTVKHERHKKGGVVTNLTDPRDIYEMTANQGARRQRACILGVIPGDVVDKAVHQCNETLKGNQAEPIADRAKKMLKAFEEMNVTKEMVEKRLGHRIDTINETELLNLRKIWKAINDNMQPVEAYFGSDVKVRESASIDVSDTLGAATEETTAPGGTSETALHPQTESGDPEPEPIEEEPPAPEQPSDPSDAPDIVPEASESTTDEEGADIVSKIKAAWKAKLREVKHVAATDDFVDMQIENFCVNFWAKMSLEEVSRQKPAWLPKLLGFIENNEIPKERYAFKLKPAIEANEIKAAADDDTPKRPGGRKKK